MSLHRMPFAAWRERFPGAFNGKALLIEEPLDFEDGLDIFAPEQTVTGSRFLGRDGGEFGFPIAEDVCGTPAKRLTSPMRK